LHRTRRALSLGCGNDLPARAPSGTRSRQR